MLKPVAIEARQFETPQAAADETTVNNVFKVLHGFYGNLFLSKFATGMLDANNRDKGVASARTVWANSLRTVPLPVVLTALERCHQDHPEFPPSLPQFVAICRAVAPRAAFKPDKLALGISPELMGAQRKANAARSRERFERHLQRVVPAAGLPTLKNLIAGAVAAAGGDEVAELNRLDRMYA